MKKFRLACADFSFPLLPHSKVLDLIRLLDFQGVDIGLFNGRSHLRPDQEFVNIRKNASQLRSQLEERGLLASDVYLQLSTNAFEYAINHPEDRIRKHARDKFLEFVEYATRLGADHISCLPGMHFQDEEYNRSVSRCYDELQWRVQQIDAKIMSFGVEPHIGSPFASPDRAEKLVSEVPGLTLTLDYTHFIYDGVRQPDIDKLIPYASHFHARGARYKKLQTSMTDNIIDYVQLMAQLKEKGYAGWIGLEYIWTEWENCNDVDNISETLRLMELIKEHR